MDIVLQTGGKIYLIELKFNKSSEEAVKQIDIKNYPERFALRGLPVVKVGLNFNSQQRTIAEWTVVTA